MNSTARIFLEHTRLFACAVILGLSFCCDLHADGVAPQKTFLNYEHLALLEVTKAAGPNDITEWGRRVKSYTLSVKVVAQIPRDGITPEQYWLRVNHRLPSDLWGQASATQDWFPVKAGQRLVVAFNGEKFPGGESPAGFGMKQVSGSNPDAEAIWYDCQTFYDVMGQAKKELAPALTQALREHQQHLGDVFFNLIRDYDHQLIDDKAFSLAAAKYLRNSAVPLQARMASVLSLREAVKRDPEANKALVSTLVELALEAKKKAKQAGLAPHHIGNLVREISSQFVSRKSIDALPKVESPAREELLALAQDQVLVPDQRYVVPLVDWLQSRTPGEIPLVLKVMPGGEPPRNLRKEYSEEELRGQKPLENDHPATTPKKEERQPKTEPVAPTGSLSWSRIPMIAVGVFSGFALLFVAIILLRKRKASP